MDIFEEIKSTSFEIKFSKATCRLCYFKKTKMTCPKIKVEMKNESVLNSFVFITEKSRWEIATWVTKDLNWIKTFDDFIHIELSIWLDLANKNLAFKLYRTTICSFFITYYDTSIVITQIIELAVHILARFGLDVLAQKSDHKTFGCSILSNESRITIQITRTCCFISSNESRISMNPNVYHKSH